MGRLAMRYCQAVIGLSMCLCLVGCGPPQESNTIRVTADQSAYVTGNPDIKGVPVIGANIDGTFSNYISNTQYYDVGNVNSFSGTTATASASWCGSEARSG